jgi:hypothetical protein
MKSVLLTVLMGLSLYVWGNVVELNSTSVNLGTLNTAQSGPANVQFVLKRTNMTPKKVRVSYSVKYQTSVCAEYDYREVWVPGYTTCHKRHDNGRGHGHGYGHGNGHGNGHYYGDHHGDRYCRWVPGYYRTDRYCVRYRDVTASTAKDLTLKFKKVNQLSAGESETFRLNLVQKHARSRRVDFSATTLETKTPYKIKKTLLGGGLKFKAQ